MNPEHASNFTRREAVKLMGAGAALLGIGALGSRAAEPSATPSATPQPFVLPPLGYAYGALEPHIDARTMEIHYSKHHASYIANANKALADHPNLASMSGEQMLKGLASVPEPIRMAVRNNVGGHVNHSFFWKIIAPGGPAKPGGALAAAIDRSFGSLSKLQAQVNDAGLKRFGSGWAWLSVKGGSLVVHSSANQDSPLSEGASPVLGVDVWEHAYYLKHQNVRADYLTDFWAVVNWSQAEANFAAAGTA